MYTACYEWHDIMISDMKYLVRIMHDMRTEKMRNDMIWI